MGTVNTSPAQVRKLCALSDLTDRANGIHAVNLALDRIIDGLRKNNTYPEPTVFRTKRIIDTKDNFDRLLFAPDTVVRSPAHTLYVSNETVMRSQTSSMISMALNAEQHSFVGDMILCCPGICFRNSRKGHLYSSEPHQVDIWRFSNNFHLNTESLQKFTNDIMSSLLADTGKKFESTQIRKDTSISHPYLSRVFKIRVPFMGKMISVGEAGVVNDTFLTSVGFKQVSAIAVGIMLDRAVMMIKDVHDVRLLRSEDARIAQQMQDLASFVPVSKFPAITRDLSIISDSADSVECVEGQIRDILGKDKHVLEKIEIISETPYTRLPTHVTKRLKMASHQKNVLIRLTFRSLTRTLRKREVDKLMSRLLETMQIT